MRVLHVIQSLDPAQGGPPHVAVRLAAAQVELGHEAALFSYALLASHAAAESASSRVPQMDRVGIHTAPPDGSLERWTAGNARQRLKELVTDFDILHLHGVWDPLVKAAAAVARRQRVPYVVTPHGMLDPWCLRQKAFKKRLALALGYRQMLNSAAFLHLLNDDELRLLEPLGLTTRLEVFPNGIFPQELELAECRGNFFRQRLGIESSRVILFLGRLHYKKGLDYLAKSFAQLPADCSDVQLVVAGPDGGARGAFLRDVENMGLSKRVHVTGPLYGADKYDALSSAACFCLPSRQEGFSIAILEALICQTPVVISENCHFPEVASAGAGEVVPLIEDQLTAALARVLRSADERLRMGRAGRELVNSRYTWPAIAERLVEAYRSGCPARWPNGAAAKTQRVVLQ